MVTIRHKVVRYVDGFHQLEVIVPGPRFAGQDDIAVLRIFADEHLLAIESE